MNIKPKENSKNVGSPQRPQRLKIQSVQGKLITLQDDPNAYIRLSAYVEDIKNIHILLGCGPLLNKNIAQLPQELLEEKNNEVYVLNNENYYKHIQSNCKIITNSNFNWIESWPQHWQSLSLSQLKQFLEKSHQNFNFWWYKQNLDINSDFWLSILGDIQAYILKLEKINSQLEIVNHQNSDDNANGDQSIIIGSSADKLLFKEVCSAFQEMGFNTKPCPLNLQDSGYHITENAKLFFSLNLQGLDKDGYDFALLRALRIPVALWFVDNPWHVLAQLRLPWWKQAVIFVTDESFIEQLNKAGANKVYHLPLAVAQHMWNAQSLIAQCRNASNERVNIALNLAINATCIFVGNASFQNKKSFFAATQISPKLLNSAYDILQDSKEKPDFHWWVKQFWPDGNETLWPGNDVRKVGLGAEQCAQRQRILWLKELLSLNTAIYGDMNLWQELLPQAEKKIFHQGLDYYTELGAVYALAPNVLNVTSLLLPNGLTQRHFDVWAAGGFLWTNEGKGLEIFPKELYKAISLKSPDQLIGAVNNMPFRVKCDIQKHWQEVLKAEHQYCMRMKYVLEIVIS